MLVNLAFENQGKVTDCPTVMGASTKYRNGQDHIAAFVNDKVKRETGKKIKKFKRRGSPVLSTPRAKAQNFLNFYNAHRLYQKCVKITLYEKNYIF